MLDEVKNLWPELDWINDSKLRQQTAEVWALALRLSSLTIDDLHEIPFTLKAKDCRVTFMEHKRAVVHMSYECAKIMLHFFGSNLPFDIDTVVSGAILADVGKLLEYDKVDDKAVVSDYGRHVRHPFSGVGLAMQCGIPDKVLHVIAAHAGEGDMVKRTTEAYIVHHTDFKSFLPFMNK
ncbi:MAG: HD domain-containing protein [Candidatus Zixiibacteriota bacterium]|nr:MAG: HD domain-containing protein [candidate division Zixibacteria bacterium]